MTKKEEQPKNERNDETPGNQDDKKYNSNITPQDKEVLNNQSQEGKGDYFKEREAPIDYAGADLDLPGDDDRIFNSTTNNPQDVEKKRRPKESANSNYNIESQSETVYKGDKAKKYKDPSEKTRDDDN